MRQVNRAKQKLIIFECHEGSFILVQSHLNFLQFFVHYFIVHAVVVDLLDIFLGVHEETFGFFYFFLHHRDITFELLKGCGIDCWNL